VGRSPVEKKTVEAAAGSEFRKDLYVTMQLEIRGRASASLLVRRSAAFMPLQLSHAPQAPNPKELSTLKRHKCRAPTVSCRVSNGIVG
jgi:hypothetical protein